MLSRTVAKRFDGTWTNKANGSGMATSLHKSMDEAITAARKMLAESGGGELHIRVNYKNRTELVEANGGPRPTD
jgi:undecaprenyl pyrophosphate synthase